LEGQLFHRLVQQHLLGLPVEKLSRLANTPDLQRWWENYLRSPDLQGLKDFKDLYPEVMLSGPLGKFRLVAKYDLIALENDTAVIYDWKTYRKRPKTERLAVRWQTRLYQALLVQAGAHLHGGLSFQPEQVRMIYWFTDYPNEPACFSYNAAQFKRDWDALVKLGEEISTAADFPKTDDQRECTYCVYRSFCDRGVEAAEGEEAEIEVMGLDINFEQVQEIAF
jgi:CRISPR/Cas system-associated exonuclease Cas4 (RecB family)